MEASAFNQPWHSREEGLTRQTSQDDDGGECIQPALVLSSELLKAQQRPWMTGKAITISQLLVQILMYVGLQLCSFWLMRLDIFTLLFFVGSFLVYCAWNTAAFGIKI